jgi:DnaJ-class molecular chaperone
MGNVISNLFIIKCEYCNGTGIQPTSHYDETTWGKTCNACNGNKSLSVFRRISCTKEKNKNLPQIFDEIR